MAWSNQFGRFTIGGKVEMNFTVVTDLDATETRALVQPVMLMVDPEANGTVEISYNDGSEHIVQVLQPREAAILEMFDKVSDIRVRPTQNESNRFMYYHASTDETA